MPSTSPPVAARRRALLFGVVLILGIGLTWWGTAALFAAGVEADLHGTAGRLDLIPLKAAVIGGVCAVGALCALAWELGLFLKRKRSRQER
ncbi:hypothetical protein [Microbacterium maritypicum]